MKKNENHRASVPPEAVGVAGVDLGKSSIKLVKMEACADGADRILCEIHRQHDGRPFEALARLWIEFDLHRCARIATTGLYSDELKPPLEVGIPEEACQEAELGKTYAGTGPLHLISFGARGYSMLTREAEGRYSYLENDKCSSGAGETLLRIVERFGLDIERADRLALEADQGVPITARCSVFAKSEMTHYANQGKRADALFRGYFTSIARNVVSLAMRQPNLGPYLLIGGGSRLGCFRWALGEALGAETQVPDGALGFEARGAARLASEIVRRKGAADLPKDFSVLVRPKRVQIPVLDPPDRFDERVRILVPQRTGSPDPTRPSVLGLDLGSTGSKATLTDIETGRALLNVYDRTRGNPVDAAQRLVRSILKACDPDVRAVAATGSGREAAARVWRASVAPEEESRVAMLNEIVAHATAAIRLDPEGGEDLSIIEIGGQDAKYIRVRGGRIVESDMNKACSAGTGSFLEEQAHLYGVERIEDFGPMAASSRNPPDLGQMCTVFVADTAAEAMAEGFSVEDLFAGFQYSVIHNYIHRVMGNRTLGRKVFFQGKPASNPSLARTLAAVTGREVMVPPNPGEMGSWGIGLCAIEKIGAAALLEAQPLALGPFLEATIVDRSEFLCKDKRCDTYCPIERIKVAAGEREATVHSGGACPKYENLGGAADKLPKDAPAPFDERERFWSRYAEDREGSRVVAIPMVGEAFRYLPYFSTFLAEAGFGVRVVASGPGSMAEGETRCGCSDACSAVKAAHGILPPKEADVLFLPKVLDVAERRDGPGRTCAMKQALPEMIEQSLKSRGESIEILRPTLRFADGLNSRGVRTPLRRMALAAGADPTKIDRAFEAAEAAQREAREALGEIGRRAMEWADAQHRPIGLICGPLHVIYDSALNAGVPDLLRKNGAIALPMDCLPEFEIDSDLSELYWADSHEAVRAALHARRRGGLYPILLSSFGCGPASFTEHLFGAVSDGWPHTMLESDGHGGAAGYVTRIQAFLHTVLSDARKRDPAPGSTSGWLAPTPNKDERPNERLVVFSISDRLSEIIAASHRAFGRDAVASGPADAESFALGRRDLSGKECLPYQLIWGSFRKYLADHPPDRPTTLLEVEGASACRNGMFQVKDRLALRDLDPEGWVRVRPFNPPDSAAFMAKIWGGLTAWDLLKQFHAYYGGLEGAGEESRLLYWRHSDDLIRLIEKPWPEGAPDPRRLAQLWRRLTGLIETAAGDWRELAQRRSNGNAAPTVLLSGDIYLRIDDFGAGGLVEALHQRGVRALIEPVNLLVDYLAEIRSSDLMGLPTGRVDNLFYKNFMRASRKRLYRRAQRGHPWLHNPEVQPMLERSATMLDRHPIGEAPITIGSSIDHWERKRCDGVICISPWGCGPALIAESLLRHRRDMPTLFLYQDGSPLDERRIDRFLYELRNDGLDLPRFSGPFA